MRNLVLSAFPKTMRPPDPFSEKLKVDKLPQMQEPPVLFSSFQHMTQVLQNLIDQCLSEHHNDKHLIQEICNNLKDSSS